MGAIRRLPAPRGVRLWDTRSVLRLATFMIGSFALAFGGCGGVTTTPNALPARPDTTATTPVVAPVLVEGERRFRAECTAAPDASYRGPDPTGRVTLSLLMEDTAGSVTTWRRTIQEIWGAYGLADCGRLGYEVDHISLATLAGVKVLLAHAPARTWHIVDPSNGAPVVDRLWARAAALPPHAGPLTVLGIEHISVNAMPGHAFRVRLRNDGPAVALEDSYRPLAFEAPARGSTWRPVASEPPFEGPLRIFARGEPIDLQVSAETARAIRAEDTLRIVFLVYGLGPDGRPTRLARALVPLGPRDRAELRR